MSAPAETAATASTRTADAAGPEAFFLDLNAAFTATLRQGAGAAAVDAVLRQAWDSFDGNLAIQCEGQAPIACGKGCPSCCSLRVSALAPEVFMVAAWVRAIDPVLQGHGIDLAQRLRAADSATRGLDEVARVALRQPCAFIVQGACVIHRVRPLACRGHASHDRRACAEAAAGRLDEVPFSGAHRTVRLLVQTALQGALRLQGLAWGAFELNHALVIALDDETAVGQWLAGGDPLAAAALDAEQREAMAGWFDQIQPP